MNNKNQKFVSNPIAQAIKAAEEFIDPLEGLVEKATANPGAPFQPEVLERLAALKQDDLPAFERLRAQLKKTDCRVTVLDEILAAGNGVSGGRVPTLAGVS